VIADTLALLEHQFKVAHIQVQPELYEDLPLIQGNAGALQQVFLNLVPERQGRDDRGRSPEGGDDEWRSRSACASRYWLGIAQETFNASTIHFSLPDSPRRPESRHGSWTFCHLRHLQEHAGNIRVESPRRRHHFTLDFPVDQKASMSELAVSEITAIPRRTTPESKAPSAGKYSFMTTKRNRESLETLLQLEGYTVVVAAPDGRSGADWTAPLSTW